MLTEAGYYLRMAAGLARHQLSARARDPLEAIRDQMRHREERFLTMARYALDRSRLYRELFKLAGCAYADLEDSIGRRGLRTTLTSLAAEGVYVTQDEFRGRSDVVRGGVHVPWDPRNWSNPWGGGINMQSTSGSTGRRFVTAASNEHMLYFEGREIIQVRMMRMAARPCVIAGPILPSAWPIRRQVIWDRLDAPAVRWFAVAGMQSPRSARAATHALVAQTRVLRGRIQYPEYLPLNDFTPMAQCLAQYCAENRPAYVRTTVSIATRAAAAAREKSLDISGTTFSVSGEPLTATKREVIESAGAQVCSSYGCTEFGHFGFGCGAMNRDDRIHLFEDGALLVPHGPNNGLLVTNLLLHGPRIAINVGLDDSAVVEPGRCDCEYQDLGFTMHAHSIFSYGKVTTQGMTVPATELIELIERELPARFGGAPGHYQVAEVEGDTQSELVVRVSPRLRNTDPDEVREFFLQRLGGILRGSLSERLWRFSGGVRVVMAEPEVTGGKIHPLRLRGRAPES